MRQGSSPWWDARRGRCASIAMSNSQSLAFSQSFAFSRRRRRPSFEGEDPPQVRGRREDRAPAGAHGPRAVKKARGRTTGSAEIPGLPCAMVLTAYSVLSPVTGLFCHRHPQDAQCIFANLAPASGRQDHTAWPSAKRSFVRIPEKECCDPSRPPLPASTSVTIAKRPLHEAG
jgi:hypothetical protein